jgi:uroporphyrinogen decarboxylase
MNEPLKNDLLLRALLREPTPRRPIWLMRQAGRYLPEYRATRARAGGFLEMCTNPEIACEITLQPVNRFPLDAAILFSDILTIPHAMNLGLEFEAGEGPQFEHPVRTPADIDKLGVPDPGRELKYVIEAVARVRRELKGRVPLIGFAGSPWTVATYMVEGGSSKTFGVIKRMMYESPRQLHRLLELLAKATILYLNAQIAAGAQAVMLFDTWGGVLTPAQYEGDRCVDAKSGRAQGSQHCLYQGRRRLVGQDRRHWLRRRRRRLDHGFERCPQSCRRARGIARQSRSFRPFRDV